MHDAKMTEDYEDFIRVIHDRYESMSKSYQKIAVGLPPEKWSSLK